VIMGFSTFFYLARTNFIQFVILFMAMKGWLILNKKSFIILGSLFLVSVLSYSAIYIYNPKRNGDSVNEFLYKIKLIPLEAFATKINRGDWKDFHDHYRSYENVRTIEQLYYNNSYLFGEGIGSQVDLKQKVRLGDMDLRHISILHNGYMTIFLKAGIPGLLLLFGSIFYFFKKRPYINELDNNINLLFLGTGLFLIVSYWVFMGYYNLLDSKTLLIGFLFAYKNQLIKKSF
uniref:O-antigen ligase family protein n=2 Tax=Flavobacterium TaxID=237 RepID=UPI0040471C76